MSGDEFMKNGNGVSKSEVKAVLEGVKTGTVCRKKVTKHILCSISKSIRSGVEYAEQISGKGSDETNAVCEWLCDNRYVFEKNLLSEIPFSPDKIVVSLGTNQHSMEEGESRRRICEFFEALYSLYRNKSTLVILPAYCGNPNIENKPQKYKRIKGLILDAAGRYPNIKAVSAYEMVPHFANYYKDDFLHPNALGMELYGNNLVKEIKKIGF